MASAASNSRPEAPQCSAMASATGISDELGCQPGALTSQKSSARARTALTKAAWPAARRVQMCIRDRRYTAGAYSEKYGGFGGQLDLTRIRGVDADYYLDGLRMITNVSTWTTQVDPFALERVEVLRGPSSAVYGLSLIHIWPGCWAACSPSALSACSLAR